MRVSHKPRAGPPGYHIVTNGSRAPTPSLRAREPNFSDLYMTSMYNSLTFAPQNGHHPRSAQNGRHLRSARASSPDAEPHDRSAPSRLSRCDNAFGLCDTLAWKE
jgi:hypothetical protein